MDSRAVLLAVTLTGCSLDMPCRNRSLSAVTAPDGGARAITFERSCGATTDFSTQVSLLRAGQDTTEAGNVFVADADHGNAPRGPGGGPKVSVEWHGSDTLLIRHHPRARVFRSEGAIGGVTIRYEHDSLP